MGAAKLEQERTFARITIVFMFNIPYCFHIINIQGNLSIIRHFDEKVLKSTISFSRSTFHLKIILAIIHGMHFPGYCKVHRN